LAKTLAEVPKNVFFPVITITIIYWLSNMHPDVNVFFTILSILVISANAAAGFGKAHLFCYSFYKRKLNDLKLIY
jgi:hypothetical protein